MSTTADRFQTVSITPAMACRKHNKASRRRERELAALQAGGWEIVDVQPQRLGTRHDRVTVRRPAGAGEPAVTDAALAAARGERPGRLLVWWRQQTRVTRWAIIAVVFVCFVVALS